MHLFSPPQVSLGPSFESPPLEPYDLKISTIATIEGNNQINLPKIVSPLGLGIAMIDPRTDLTFTNEQTGQSIEGLPWLSHSVSSELENTFQRLTFEIIDPDAISSGDSGAYSAEITLKDEEMNEGRQAIRILLQVTTNFDALTNLDALSELVIDDIDYLVNNCKLVSVTSYEINFDGDDQGLEQIYYDLVEGIISIDLEAIALNVAFELSKDPEFYVKVVKA